jgi:N-carbamoylputrescine amidase
MLLEAKDIAIKTAEGNTREGMERPVTVAMMQGEGWGVPASTDVEKNLEYYITMIDRLFEEHRSDFIVLPELFTTPYFCGTHDKKFFELAETIPGRTTDRLAEKAREYGCYILASIFEKVVPGEYYDSAALIDPDGNIVMGVLPDGNLMKCYRKTHVATLYAHTTRTDEKFFFRPGQGFPTFDTKFGKIGVLICYDRSFPEPWRSLVLQGAELILLPVVSYGFRRKAFTTELQTRAMENIVFCAAANRGGPEDVEFEVTCFGASVALDPRGEVIVEGSDDTGPEIILAHMDLAEVEKVRIDIPYLRDRRPDIYIMEDLTR